MSLNLEKYNIWHNKDGCIELESKYNRLGALLEGTSVFIFGRRKVIFERKYDSPESAKKAFIEKVKEYL